MLRVLLWSFFFFSDQLAICSYPQAILENGPVAELEKSLVDLVKSNALPSDDKITVGTIRR